MTDAHLSICLLKYCIANPVWVLWKMAGFFGHTAKWARSTAKNASHCAIVTTCSLEMLAISQEVVQGWKKRKIGISSKQWSLQTNYCQSTVVITYWEVSGCRGILISFLSEASLKTTRKLKNPQLSSASLLNYIFEAEAFLGYLVKSSLTGFPHYSSYSVGSPEKQNILIMIT